MAESSASSTNGIGMGDGHEGHDESDFGGGGETEMKFEQGGVSQRFPVNGKLRNTSILIPGKLFITENKFGEYLEWKPIESRASSPFVTGYPELHGAGGTSGGIGYRPGKSEEESVEFLRDPKEAEYRRPIKVELSELRSFVVTPKNATREVIFFHSDGTILNTFVFERGSPENFITALERSVSIKKSKDRSKNLFLICPKVESPGNSSRSGVPGIPPEVAELFPNQMNQINHLWGFVKEFKNDPYTTSCTALAKLAHNTLNGEHPISVFHKQEDTSSEEHSPSRNRNEESANSEGLDADYTTNEEGYEVIFTPDRLGIDLPKRPETFRGQPLSQEQWLNYLDNEGQVTNMEDIRSIVFRGGVDPEIRKHVWPLILGVYSASSTYEERKKQYTEHLNSYNRMKLQWMSITEDQEERFFAFRDFKSLIEKDVNRTDRAMEFFKGDESPGLESLRNILMTYMMYNFNLGYVQGMSDILAPILMEIQDEILAFWLFVKFMERIHTNFEMSQEGMQNQLRDIYILLQLVDPKFSAYLDACDAANMYFGFRWLLILFKREFRHPDVLTLWECLWTTIPGPNFQLFIGLAILEANRDTVMTNKYGLSEILRHVNDLNLRINLEDTLTAAEAIYLQVLAVQDKLPNNIRKIIGLSEIPEVNTDNPELLNGDVGSGRNSSSASRSGDAAVVTSRTGMRDNSGNEHSVADSLSSSDAQTLENQYESGISQFM